MTLTTGTRLGPYEVLGPLGAGGMGEVYRARDTKLGRDVALKVLPAAVASDAERMARFRREAQVLASLNHPNIAQLHGLEDSGSIHALVMELVEGPTLADRILQGPIPLDEALPIARQIAEALGAAHEQGIVHRDLKPANVKVRDDGTVKVLDFGLARASDPMSSASGDQTNSPTLTAHATQMGVIIGTAAYMAPEQAKGKSVDRRADIWAFGVVLFEMLSGQRAFKGDDVSDTLAAVLRQEIEWKALPAGIPPRVRRVMERCLERDPKRRVRDIGDVWFELDAPPEAAPAPAPATVAAHRSALSRALPWIAAALIAAASVAWAVMRTPPPAPPRVVTRAMSHLKVYAAFAGVSADGTKLAYTQASGSSTEIALRMLDQFEGKVIPGTDGAGYPLFSPDGQWIAYGSVLGSPQLKKIPLTGGTSITLCDGSLENGATWSADDTIVFASAKGLMRVPASGGTPQPLTTVDAAKGEAGHIRPQFLPDGKHLLFTVLPVNQAESPQFAVLDLAKGVYAKVAKGGDAGRYARSGHLIYMRGTTLFALPFDNASQTVTGGEVPVVENMALGPNGTGDYALSDAGLLMYFAGEGAGLGTTMAWADRSGRTKVLPGQAQKLWGTGRLSPDGRLMANTITDDKGAGDLWIFDVQRGVPTRLTFGSNANDPIWTPDSRTIIYRGTQDGKSGFFSVVADGSGKPAFLFATDASAIPHSMTPDGKTLLFSQTESNKRRRIMVVGLGSPAGTAKAAPLHDTSSPEGTGMVSPDGRLVAYVSMDSGSPEIYLHAFPGPGPRLRVSTQGGSDPRWSHNGRELLYRSNTPTPRFVSVEVTPGAAIHVGEPVELFKMFAGTTWDVTPDRDRLLVELTASRDASSYALVTEWFEELRHRAPAKK